MIDTPEVAKEVYCRYAAIAGNLDPEHGLGGQLLYADVLDRASIQLVRAANIAGAASFTTSTEATALREAMRDGVVDFVVTTLDEALRILKNEIRKKQSVSVGIHCGDIAAFTQEMRERGVRPDLLRVEPKLLHGAIEWLMLDVPAGDASFARNLEAAVLNALPADDHAARRWYRLAPRYLPRSLRGLRTVACNQEAARRIRSWFEQAMPA